MNWGIMSLLVVVVIVLSCVAGFFLYLARRSANLKSGRASVSESPDFLGLPQELDFPGPPFLPTRPGPLRKPARAVP